MELVIQNKQREKEEKAGRQKTFFDKKEELNERLQLLDRENFRLQNQRERLNERLDVYKRQRFRRCRRAI